MNRNVVLMELNAKNEKMCFRYTYQQQHSKMNEATMRKITNTIQSISGSATIKTK